MKKNFFYVLFSSLLSSFLSLGIYKLYYENKNTSITYLEVPKEEIKPVKLVSQENYASLLTSANLPDFVVPAENAINAVVHVKNYSNQAQQPQGLPFDPFEFFFGFPDLKKRQNPPAPKNKEKKSIPKGYGSGIIISSDGYIVTNNHVIEGADKIMITLNDQTTYQAKVIGADPASDIALLKINPKNKKLEFLPFGNSDEAKVGESVLAVGNPMGLTSTVTAGIVSAKNRNLGILNKSNVVSPIESFIQTDAAVNPGSSGGALVNIKNKIIGMITAISSTTGTYIGYGFAIPSKIVEKVVEDLKKYGFVQRAYLGIQAIDLSNEELLEHYKKSSCQENINDRNGFDKKNRKSTKECKFIQGINSQQGVLVDEFSKNSAAKLAGIRKYDIIKYIDNELIKTFSSLSSVLASKRPGDKIEVGVLREGKKEKIKVTLKSIEGKAKIKTRDQMSALELLGAEFKPINKEEKEKFKLANGLRISEIDKGGILYRNFSLEVDDIVVSINNKSLSNSKDVDAALKNYLGKLKEIEFIKVESKSRSKHSNSEEFN